MQTCKGSVARLTMEEELGGTFHAAVVFCPHPSDGTILYVGRSTYGDKVGGVPGGKLEPGETFRNAAIREFKEETGLDLATISTTPLWSGVTVKSGAYVQWFLGTLSDETWSGLPTSFMGPEGHLVRRERWELMCYEGHCEYFEFYRRFLQNLAANPGGSKIFKEHGVNEAVLNRIKMSVNNLIAERE